MRPGFKTYKSPYTSILVIKCNGVSDFRVTLAARHLSAAGYDVEIISQVPYYKAAAHDIFLCCRPGEDMCKFLDICVKAGKKVIVDMDDDFFSIPPKNSAYAWIGAGHPTYHITLKKLLSKVHLTYASPELVNRYKLPGTIIPNCYDEENVTWEEPKHPSDKVRLGFTGTATHQADFKTIIEQLQWILKERKDVKLVIGNDYTVYDQFRDIPNDQKLFIPPLSYDSYPISFKHIDILLVPLQDNYFNRAKSMIKLIEAGASRTPWLASSVPVYEQWGVGGKCVPPGGDWAKEILALIDDPQLRKEYGEAGHTLALEHTSKKVSELWLKLVEEVANGQ
jgi:glycosyltransferase involved in cell wall biosynthesis